MLAHFMSLPWASPEIAGLQQGQSLRGAKTLWRMEEDLSPAGPSCIPLEGPWGRHGQTFPCTESLCTLGPYRSRSCPELFPASSSRTLRGTVSHQMWLEVHATPH